MAYTQTKAAKQRLSVLELAETLGIIFESCRRCGMTRNLFYHYKRTFHTHRFEGLKDLPLVAESHPHSSPEATIERFHRTALDESYRIAFRQHSYESIEELRRDFDAWLHHYNTERPDTGYRN